MTNVFEESLMPECIHAAIINLQCVVMTLSEQPVAGETAERVIEIAKNCPDEEIRVELSSLRDLVNEELRHTDRDKYRTYNSLKGLAKCL